MEKRLLITIFVVLLSLFASPALAQSNPFLINNPDRVSGQILVKFKTQIPQNIIDRELKSFGAGIIDRVNALDVLVLNVPQVTQDQIVAALSKNPNVEFAEPNFLAFASMTPS